MHGSDGVLQGKARCNHAPGTYAAAPGGAAHVSDSFFRDRIQSNRQALRSYAGRSYTIRKVLRTLLMQPERRGFPDILSRWDGTCPAAAGPAADPDPTRHVLIY